MRKLILLLTLCALLSAGLGCSKKDEASPSVPADNNPKSGTM